MKAFVYLTLFILALSSCGKKIPSTAVKETFHVSGNCGMCKKTIEKSVKMNGVFEAKWDKKTKDITVVFDTTIVTLDQIKKSIAAAGYDNDGYRADDVTYGKLHSCCHYEREK